MLSLGPAFGEHRGMRFQVQVLLYVLATSWFVEMEQGTYRRGKSKSLFYFFWECTYLTLIHLLRYCNMDFIALSALVGVVLSWVIFTYDIGCQWSKNLASRIEDFPEDMRIKDSTKLDVAIPSWHINGHGAKCRDNFNLAYMKGAGRTCGDEIEGSWSHTNPLATSVQEMGPGARHETFGMAGTFGKWSDLVC
jgi:hypothetical protein